jgi:hypothetical protein
MCRLDSKEMMLDIILTSNLKLSGRPGCWTLITLPGSEVPILFPVGTRPENKAQSGSDVDPEKGLAVPNPMCARSLSVWKPDENG